MGPNILVNRMEGLTLPGIFDVVEQRALATAGKDLSTAAEEVVAFSNAIVVAFQLLTQAGPLCDEPVMGVCFEILDVQVDAQAPEPDSGFGGQVIAAAKEGFRQVGAAMCVHGRACVRDSSSSGLLLDPRSLFYVFDKHGNNRPFAPNQAFLVQPVRLMTAIYSCDLFVNSSSLGKVRPTASARP